MKQFSGIITPVVTPFRNDEVNEPAVERLMGYLNEIGVSGVFPAGSNGSSPFMSMKTHKKTLDIFSKFRKEGQYFMPGVGKNNIEDTIELSRYAQDLASDAIVLVTPYYMKVSQESIYSYFESVVGKVDLPVLLYNIPQLTGNTIRPETIVKLSENYSNIAGIKDSSGNLSLFQDYLIKLPAGMNVFQGQDEFLLSSLVIGASGGVCGTTNFNDSAVKVMNLFRQGKIEEAGKVQRKLSTLKNYLNEQQFPQVFSFLFHRLVLGEESTGTYSMLASLDTNEMEKIYRNVRDIIGPVPD